ncbi:MAG: hypothetical protein IPH07_23790 [Deltaproteobacteria bacterium]|nr:hypothetical protein [Deltaproteobacteria bacterium]
MKRRPPSKATLDARQPLPPEVLADAHEPPPQPAGRLLAATPVHTLSNITAWRVAAALALACGLDWGRWAVGLTAEIPTTPGLDCDECCGWGGYTDHLSDQWYSCSRGCATPADRARVPVSDPSDADAYRADCARRGVEPGPLPSLEHWGAKTGVFFRVNAGVRIDVGGACWTTITFGGAVHVATDSDGCEAAELALLSTLVTAAAAALEC